ncbi:MAG: hypothetical protein HY033_00595 [Ignavibacteriae bacterium]|nr:hypothetical protein [Ignavibacteria bacterium]MBI3363387.1 hypothetical protein [Ignavibacteriota bacterium]
MKFTLVLSTMLAFIIFFGCSEQKLQPVPVGEMQEYRDPGYGFSIKYPKDWKQLGTTGQAVFAKSQEVLDKFRDPKAGIEGGQVSVDVITYAGKSPNDIITQTMEELKANNAEIDSGKGSNYGSYPVAGKNGKMIPYRIQATTKKSIYGHYVFVAGDTAMYRLNFEGFGDQYGLHVPLFEEMLKSFQIPVVVAKKADVWNPSANLEALTSNYFSAKYPDNLEFMNVAKGDKDYVVKLRADRLDCSIQIDVFGAKGLTVEKVWDQNKGKFKSRGNGEATIGGNKSIWVDYSPVANIMSRTYFVVKNDKVIRATVTWFAVQKDVYFPVFEKIVTTMNLK